MSYLEPSSIYGMVIAESPESAALKFKEATGFDTAPAELNASIDSIELVEADVGDITSMDEYINEKNKRTLN